MEAMDLWGSSRRPMDSSHPIQCTRSSRIPRQARTQHIQATAAIPTGRHLAREAIQAMGRRPPMYRLVSRVEQPPPQEESVGNLRRGQAAPQDITQGSQADTWAFRPMVVRRRLARPAILATRPIRHRLGQLAVLRLAATLPRVVQVFHHQACIRLYRACPACLLPVRQVLILEADHLECPCKEPILPRILVDLRRPAISAPMARAARLLLGSSSRRQVQSSSSSKAGSSKRLQRTAAASSDVVVLAAEPRGGAAVLR